MSAQKSPATATAKLALATVVVAVLLAMAAAPIAGLTSVALARTAQTMASDVADLGTAETPGVSVIQDSQGTDMAYIFRQRRHPVAPADIAQVMKDAIVAIEDRRFYEHNGVDFQGNFRAAISNIVAGGVTQGASTLNQQYVKNYLLLVAADSDEERAAATEQSIGRKLREIKTAVEIDKELSKDQILSNYLNLVPFGNHAYGIEAAARTYFGTSAAELTLAQAAMLAGMVQSSEFLNPYTNYEGALQRRNTVLSAMADVGYISAEEAAAAAATDLGVLERPATLPNGCIAAGDQGFFCDYVLNYLESKNLPLTEIAHGGYTIRTTLDPQIQAAAKAAVDNQTHPQAAGIAEVMNVIEPADNERKILAMVSSRSYGLDLEQSETILPQPASLVGNGAGSVFKVFTAAAAIEAGYGIKNILEVPTRYEAEGLGFGGAENCPPLRYCAENAGSYQSSMTLEDALAYSPNTTFIQLEEQLGVPAVVDMAVKLGLRSYTEPGTYGDDALATFAAEAPMGSFTLGPTAVNPLELANVGASIAAGGIWCEPNPVLSVTAPTGHEVFVETPPCEQVMRPDAARALANAMAADTTRGTGAQAAAAMGFSGQAATKTGTTEENRSAAFLGFNSRLAAAPYIYNDGTSNSPLCSSPARQCDQGNMFGGQEPARSFFQLASGFGGELPAYDPAFDEGTTGDSTLDNLRGRSEDEARLELSRRGYEVSTRTAAGNGVIYGRVMRVLITGDATATIVISDGRSAISTPVEAEDDDPVTLTPPRRRTIDDEIDSFTARLREAFGFSR